MQCGPFPLPGAPLRGPEGHAEALLEVAVCIAQPFATGSEAAPGRIPMEKLLQNLETPGER